MNLRVVLAAVALAALWSCGGSPSADVAATVNKRPITYQELDRTYKEQFLTNSESASQDQAMVRRMEVLRTLVDNEILLQRAEKAGLIATDSEVETKFTEMKTPFTQDEFERQLKDRHLTAVGLKTQLRKQLSIEKLINKEITSKINITDADVRAFYTSNRKSFNLPEPQVHMAQIVVTPNANQQVSNLKNDKAQNDEQARKKIQTVNDRLKQGEDFATLAQNFSEDPATAPNGGDLGFLAESAFDRTGPDLRKLILSMRAGEVSPILPSPEGYRILKMISREPAGQRELTDPRVQQTIRDTLLNRKDQLLRTAYYETARNEASVVNLLARDILVNSAKTSR